MLNAFLKCGKGRLTSCQRGYHTESEAVSDLIGTSALIAGLVRHALVVETRAEAFPNVDMEFK